MGERQSENSHSGPRTLGQPLCCHTCQPVSRGEGSQAKYILSLTAPASPRVRGPQTGNKLKLLPVTPARAPVSSCACQHPMPVGARTPGVHWRPGSPHSIGAYLGGPVVRQGWEPESRHQVGLPQAATRPGSVAHLGHRCGSAGSGLMGPILEPAPRSGLLPRDSSANKPSSEDDTWARGGVQRGALQWLLCGVPDIVMLTLVTAYRESHRIFLRTPTPTPTPAPKAGRNQQWVSTNTELQAAQLAPPYTLWTKGGTLRPT